MTVDASDLPNVLAMTSYGISATQTSNGSYQMILPLVPVERGGKTYALQAKVYQDRPSLDNVIRWRDMRLKWAVQGDVLRPADDGSGQMVPSPTGNYGLIIYGRRLSDHGRARVAAGRRVGDGGGRVSRGESTLRRGADCAAARRHGSAIPERTLEPDRYLQSL